MITQARLKEVLHYDPDTGVFVWIKPTSKQVMAGSLAGCLEETKGKIYLRIGVDGKRYKAHRLAWLYQYGTWPVYGIDHKDGDGTNNPIKNLRDVPQSDNCKNRAIQKNNRSGFNGVSWVGRDNLWRVTYNTNGSRHQVLVKTLLDAVAIKIGKNREYGFHENHGRAF